MTAPVDGAYLSDRAGLGQRSRPPSPAAGEPGRSAAPALAAPHRDAYLTYEIYSAPIEYSESIEYIDKQRLAHQATAAAIRKGSLIRSASCEVCGVSCKPDAHHDDYDAPLSIRWLCRACHMGAHESRRPFVTVLIEGKAETITRAEEAALFAATMVPYLEALS